MQFFTTVTAEAGRVTYARGSVIASAAVSIVEQQTNLETKIATNNSGYYTAGFLKLGSFSVEVTAIGFEGERGRADLGGQV